MNPPGIDAYEFSSVLVLDWKGFAQAIQRRQFPAPGTSSETGRGTALAHGTCNLFLRELAKMLRTLISTLTSSKTMYVQALWLLNLNVQLPVRNVFAVV